MSAGIRRGSSAGDHIEIYPLRRLTAPPLPKGEALNSTSTYDFLLFNSKNNFVLYGDSGEKNIG